MKNNLDNIIHNMIKILIVSTFFDAYSLLYIGTYPVTLFTLVAVVTMFIGAISFFYRTSKIYLRKSSIVLLMFALYLFFNFAFYSFANSTSFILISFFVVLYVLSYRRITTIQFEEYISVFNKGMNVLAVYGIYQFVARINALPFADIIFEDHMVSGFNWSNVTYLLGNSVYRSNAIFREPSYFSQFLAINILLYFDEIITNGIKNKKITMILLINLLALLLTLSGTCFIILFVSALLYILIMKKNKKIYRRVFLWSSLALLVINVAIFILPIGDYFISRMQELFVYNADASAGYVRFRSWTKLLNEAWTKNMFFGEGIGASKYMIEAWSDEYFAMTLNGFARVAIELGLVGIIIWMIFILSFALKKEKCAKATMLACIIIPFMICHETFSSNYYWIFLIIQNVRIIDFHLIKRKENGGRIYEKN